MSRIGKLPIAIPTGVTVDVKDNMVTVKGKLGELSQEIKREVVVEIKDNEIYVSRVDDAKTSRSFHGLYRALINNMVIGVSEGFEVKQELVGVGYKAEVKGQVLELALGYTHPIHLVLAPEIKIEAEAVKRGNPIITIKSHDKQLLGQVVAKIRSFRPPEPYKGKGIKFVGEQLRRKAGKTAGK
ncbi:MAG: 50S ribosomal protein L6 [Bacteroidales bacterium]|nr:50S ribosomal protein L6 [Bacteroidales bacterium]